MYNKIFGFLATLLLSSNICLASQPSSQTPVATDTAFEFTAAAHDANTLNVRFKILPGYYLYKNQLKFTTENSDQGTLTQPTLPVGIKKHVEDLGVFEVYTDLINLTLPYQAKASADSVNLVVTYQGCSDEGYCYPPTTKKVSLNLTNNFEIFQKGTTIDTVFEDENAGIFSGNSTTTSAQDSITNLLRDKSLLTILLSFFGFGLLLAFTPCVLPMVPILSSIIVGQKHAIKTSKAFSLSLTYVIAMSLAYAIAGVLVGYVGGSIQVMMQTPWFIGFASATFVALALSLFGLYELRLPSRWQTALTKVSNSQAGGSYLGVAIMGFLAALIVSPCVTPALVGALGYIAKTGDALLGGTALFTLGLGMGTPLLVIGTAGGKLLPKAGVWMSAVSHFFGVIMLGMAIWMLDRIVPSQITLALWSALAIIVSVYLGAHRSETHNNTQHFFKGLGTILMVYGCTLLVGVGMGNTNPLLPLEGLNVGHGSSTYVPESYYKNVQNVDDAQKQIKQSQKLVLLDFYADWCTSCILMEKNVLNDPKVKPFLDKFTVLKANVTHNDQNNKELQKAFNIVAPPTYVFLTPDGQELANERIVGEVNSDEFVTRLQRMIDRT